MNKCFALQSLDKNRGLAVKRISAQFALILLVLTLVVPGFVLARRNLKLLQEALRAAPIRVRVTRQESDESRRGAPTAAASSVILMKR